MIWWRPPPPPPAKPRCARCRVEVDLPASVGGVVYCGLDCLPAPSLQPLRPELLPRPSWSR